MRRDRLWRIVQKYGLEGLTAATLMAGVMLLVMGFARLSSVIKFVPTPLVTGFPLWIVDGDDSCAPVVPRLGIAEMTTLVAPAFSIEVLDAVESLLSAVVADGMIGATCPCSMLRAAPERSPLRE